MGEVKSKIIKRAVALGSIVVSCSVLLGYYRFSQGLLVGILFSIANFRLLARNIERSIEKKTRNIHAFFFVNYVIRFLLTAILLAASMYFKGIEFFLGVSLGLILLIKFGVYSLYGTYR